MKTSLIVFLCILVFLFLILIFSTIRKKQMLLKYSLLWIIFSILMLLSVLMPGAVEKISSFLGFEVASNMVFLVGLILLLLITFALTSIISGQRLKTVTLTQEMGIIDKKVREIDEKDYL